MRIGIFLKRYFIYLLLYYGQCYFIYFIILSIEKLCFALEVCDYGFGIPLNVVEY